MAPYLVAAHASAAFMDVTISPLRRSPSSCSSMGDAADITTTNTSSNTNNTNNISNTSNTSNGSGSGSITKAKIDRWQQLRQMLHVLSGLKTNEPSSASPTPEETRRQRRRRPAQRHDCPILLLHHDFWLEALDKTHRYGFHLRIFHDLWKQEMNAENWQTFSNLDRSFFDWLDHGNGSHLQVPECSRATLNATRVQYCSHQQSQQFQVDFDQTTSPPRLEFASSRTPVQTDSLSKWIFVLSQDDKLYIGRKRKGFFHHSSFLAGAPIIAAGKIYVTSGKIYAVEPHSGHFKPKLSNLMALCDMFQAHGVNMDDVHVIKPKKWKGPWPFTITSVDEDEDAEDKDGFLPCLDGSPSDSEDS